MEYKYSDKKAPLWVLFYLLFLCFEFRDGLDALIAVSAPIGKVTNDSAWMPSRVHGFIPDASEWGRVNENSIEIKTNSVPHTALVI